MPTPIATASGKKLALASPAAGVGVVFGQAEQAGATLKRLPTPFLWV